MRRPQREHRSVSLRPLSMLVLSLFARPPSVEKIAKRFRAGRSYAVIDCSIGDFERRVKMLNG
jgi:hypothetical protein